MQAMRVGGLLLLTDEEEENKEPHEVIAKSHLVT